MKKLILSSLVSGLGYGLVLAAGLVIFHDATTAIWSLVFGVTIGTAILAFRIPAHVCGPLRSFKSDSLSLAIIGIIGFSILASTLALVDAPSSSFADPSFGWAMLGGIGSSIVYALVFRLLKPLKHKTSV